MRGHATKEEEARVRGLESRVDLKTSPLSQLLELGLMYQEPCHEEDQAILCLEAILARDSNCSLARIWLAYILLHYRMDNASSRRARQLLRPIVATESRYRAAALKLTVDIGDDLGDLSPNESMDLLYASVVAAPDWVLNREILASHLSRAGKTAEAIEQLSMALANIKSADPDWNFPRQQYEIFITGRIAEMAADRIAGRLAKLRS